MELSGIGGINGPDGNGKHTQSDLNIFGYNEISIFNEIDMSDGKMDGYLTDKQLDLFYSRTHLRKPGSLSKEAQKRLAEKAPKSKDEPNINFEKIANKYKNSGFSKS